MQARAMKIPKRRAQLALILVEIHMRQLIPLPADHITLLRARRVRQQFLFHAPGDEDPRRVGQTLDPGAYFSYFGRGFEDGDAVAGEAG
jgi:hypothetical protein